MLFGQGTVVLRDGIIEAVGAEVLLPMVYLVSESGTDRDRELRDLPTESMI